MTGRSIALFIVAAIAEIGGAYLMWQAIKEGRGVLLALAGAAALAGYGAVAALQPDAHFGRVLAAYGGVFIVGSLLWGMILRRFQARSLRCCRGRRLPRRCRGDHVRAPLTSLLAEKAAHCGRCGGGRLSDRYGP